MLIALLLIQTMPPAINYEQYYPFNSIYFYINANNSPTRLRGGK